MAEAITMPKLGFDMREGVLIRWVKNEGEAINKGDILAEIETDKATVEVELHASGTVRKLFGGQGDSIPVGATMAIIGSADENVDSLMPVVVALLLRRPQPRLRRLLPPPLRRLFLLWWDFRFQTVILQLGRQQ